MSTANQPQQLQEDAPEELGTPPPSRVSTDKPATPAAIWNRNMMHLLQATLIHNPEADLATVLPKFYSRKLESLKKTASPPKIKSRSPTDNLLSRMRAADKCTAVFDLSDELGEFRPLANAGERLADALSTHAPVCEWTGNTGVYRVGETDIAVKVTYQDGVLNEYETLLYIQQSLPAFPAPRPHGLLRLGALYCSFTSLIPGLNLEQAWPLLDGDDKESIRTQLDRLLVDLRSLPIPVGSQLGGLKGGCKDVRKSKRICPQPINNPAQFEDFIFEGMRCPSTIYVDFLRHLQLELSSNCVFTHGDLRPENVMVAKESDGGWRVKSVVDWESSGIYPEYWESVKMTNSLSIMSASDWYQYLPDSIGPQRYRIQWLVDRLRDRYMQNS